MPLLEEHHDSIQALFDKMRKLSSRGEQVVSIEARLPIIHERDRPDILIP
jgi:hypothetical protein